MKFLFYLLSLLLFQMTLSAQHSLQMIINNSNEFDTLRIESPLISEPILITKPVTLIGIDNPVIDGKELGSVITVKSDNVSIIGFIIQHSGKNVIDESAGITIEGNNVLISKNEIRNVFFGIHVMGGKKIKIMDNIIHPGKEYATRQGHVINIWNCKESVISGNTISDGRDGIFLNYNANILIENNTVTNCRYALHSMYSANMTFTGNHLSHNLLGCALMYSKNLIAKNNIIEWQRTGSSPYGFLLKDIESLTIENNQIRANSTGIYAEGVSQQIGSHSLIANNTIEGNDCAFALHSTVNVVFTNNKVIDNLSDIRRLGNHISEETKWNENKSGNYWSSYRGYDLNSDQVGDQAFTIQNTLDKMSDPRNPLRVFLHTPSHKILESMVEMFPVLNGSIIMTDEFPEMNSASLISESDHSGLFISTLVLAVMLSVTLFFIFSKYAERNWI